MASHSEYRLSADSEDELLGADEENSDQMGADSDEDCFEDEDQRSSLSEQEDLCYSESELQNNAEEMSRQSEVPYISSNVYTDMSRGKFQFFLCVKLWNSFLVFSVFFSFPLPTFVLSFTDKKTGNFLVLLLFLL